MKKLRFWSGLVADDHLFLMKIGFLVLVGNAITDNQYYDYFFIFSLILHKNLIFNSLNNVKLLWVTTPLNPKVIFLSKNIIILFYSILLSTFLIITTPMSQNDCLNYSLNIGFCLIFGNFISNHWANSERGWQTNFLIVISYGLSAFLVYLCDNYLRGAYSVFAFFLLFSGLVYSILEQRSFVQKYFLITKILRNDSNR